MPRFYFILISVDDFPAHSRSHRTYVYPLDPGVYTTSLSLENTIQWWIYYINMYATNAAGPVLSRLIKPKYNQLCVYGSQGRPERSISLAVVHFFNIFPRTIPPPPPPLVLPTLPHVKEERAEGVSWTCPCGSRDPRKRGKTALRYS